MNQLSKEYIKIDEDINSSWLRQDRGSDILKGGAGSGIKGHKTQQTKGERLSYTAEKKRWMKEKLTPEQKKQLEDIKKIEQDLAEKRKELSVTVDHDIWVNSVNDSRAKLKQIKRDLRSLPSKARKVSNFEIEEAEYNFLHARPDMMNATGLELVRIKNKYIPDEQEGPPETWIKYNKKTQEELKEKDEENILALHKDADITEIGFLGEILKGGVGSGVKGHTTSRKDIIKIGLKSATPELKKRIAEISAKTSELELLKKSLEKELFDLGSKQIEEKNTAENKTEEKNTAENKIEESVTEKWRKEAKKETKEKIKLGDKELVKAIQVIPFYANEGNFVDVSIKDWYYETDMGKLDSAVTEVFGLPLENSKSEEKSSINDQQKKYFLEIFTLNQELMKRKYPSGKVTVYRGIGPESLKKFGKAEIGKEIDFGVRNLSCWTEDSKVAHEFAAHKGKGAVLKIEVPIKNIFLHHSAGLAFQGEEKEITLLGTSFKGEISKILR